MNILGFCEGTRPDSGGVGLVGVPLIHHALARNGFRDVLVVGGPAIGRAIPPAEQMLCHRVDQILCHQPAAARMLSLPAVGRWCFSPALYHAAAPLAARADFIMLHSVFSFPVLAGYALARRYRKPYGVWPHGVFAPLQQQVGRYKKAAYNALVSRRMLDNASVLFYSAEGEREEAAALALEAPSVIIPHGIDTDAFAALPARGAFRQKYLRGHLGPLVLYLGRLNVKKGLDLLAPAMARAIQHIPDARLVIAGAGDPPSFADNVRSWVQDAGVAHATVMTGPLDERDKLTAFSDCDLFVLPSAAENFGFAMFEAMASGRAVVCSDSLNYASEVAREEAGLVVRRSPVDIGEAMVLLLRDGERRARFGENGRRLAQRYSWDLCGERLEAAILSVLAKRPFSADLMPACASSARASSARVSPSCASSS